MADFGGAAGARGRDRSVVRSGLRAPGTLNISIEGVEGETLILNLPGYALSSGSACASHEPGPSPALLAMGIGEDRARSSIRIGLGRQNSDEEIEAFVADLVGAVERLRGDSSAS